MEFTYSIKGVLLLAVALLLNGCVGLVGGELKNVPPVALSECRAPLPEYRLKIESSARNDYGHSNLSGLISTITLGVIPTYWPSSVHSSALLYKEGTLVSSYQYTAKAHTFYGVLWPLVLRPESENRLGWNEGTGLEVEQGIRQRAAAKALAQFGVGVKDACYFLGVNP